jgi:rfaE bifunctional protein nucleotidyltransferase chain/domain
MEKTWEKQGLKKLLKPNQLEKKINELKQQGKTIVTLNGSFDLLHAGHLQIIYEASLLGDILIMALNSDRSIKKYKSEKRPIIPLNFRILQIAALEFVDFVTYFDEVDPCNILGIIKPNIHVNGKEYGMDCKEAQTVKKYGGKMHLVDRVFSLSTTDIIEKIKCD